MRSISTILTFALLLLSALLAVDLIRQTRADLIFHFARGLPDLQRAHQLDPGRAAIPLEIANGWMNAFPPRPDRALPAYQEAAAQQPEEGLNWIGLARANLRLGRLPQATRALATAEFIDPNNRVIQKALGNLYLELGDEQRTVEHHARALALDPGLLPTLAPYYLSLGMTPRTFAERLLSHDPGLLDQLFATCLSNGSEPADISALWDYLTTQPGATPLSIIRLYFAYLIEHQDFAGARNLWGYVSRTFYHHDWDAKRELFWNADLSRKPLFPGGLEWQIADPVPTGCEIEITRPDSRVTSRCLAIRFDGTKNLDFSHVSHAFFVEPGRHYVLRCHAQGHGLTTDNGPYLAVVLHAQPMLVAKTKVLTESGSWDLALDFTAPEDCHWGELRIRRDNSTRLNNKIKGEVLFDSFMLFPGQDSQQGAEP